MIGVEIIIGIVVLILVIVGVAQLRRRRGSSRGPVDIEGAIKMTSDSKKAFLQALYKNPEEIEIAIENMDRAGTTAKEALSALYQHGKITRAQVDAISKKYQNPISDRIDYLKSVLDTNEIIRLAAYQYQRRKIDFPEFQAYVKGAIKTEEDSFKLKYTLRHKGD